MAKAAKPAGKKPGGKKAMTKSQFIGHLADKAGVTKKQVDTILSEIVEVIKKEVGPSGPKKFVFPGLARFVLKQKAAVKGGERKINPLTKTEYITKDKPAQNIIRARPVKAAHSLAEFVSAERPIQRNDPGHVPGSFAFSRSSPHCPVGWGGM